MKINLTNTTFVIPVKIDSTKRLFNLNLIIDYLLNYFDTNIIVGEEGSNKCKNIGDKCLYYSFNYNINFFHRTRLLNDLYKLCDTEVICNYDSDVLLEVDKYTKSTDIISNGEFDVVFPYSGIFYDVREQYHQTIRNKLSIDFLSGLRHHIRNHMSVGGAIFFNKESLFDVGLENENFKSWGYEDLERIYRFEKMGYRITRLNGNLYHLVHPKGSDSNKNNVFYESNRLELEKIKAMSKNELIKYIGIKR